VKTLDGAGYAGITVGVHPIIVRIVRIVRIARIGLARSSIATSTRGPSTCLDMAPAPHSNRLSGLRAHGICRECHSDTGSPVTAVATIHPRNKQRRGAAPR
jgi:hypothetical protein